MNKNMCRAFVEKFFLFFVILIFFIDIVGIALFEKPILQALTALYVVTLCSRSTVFLESTILLFFLCIGSFFQHGCFGFYMLYLLPQTYILWLLKNKIDVVPLVYYLLVIACLCIKFLIVEPYAHQTPISMPFIAASVGINLCVTYIFMRFFVHKDTRQPHKKYSPFI